MKPDVDDVVDDLIVGAGLAGLTLAGELMRAGHRVLVVEKSRGVGGRMATRRAGESVFDHGAQFYRTPPDTDQAKTWSECGLIAPWFEAEGRQHWAAVGGMTRIAKNLAAGIPLSLNAKVMQIQVGSTATLVRTEGEASFTAKRVHLSCPLPQSLELLRSSAIAYTPALEQISYAKAVVGLFEVDTSHDDFHRFKYAEDVNLEVYSISNQASKGVSPRLAFTVVMRPEWSAAHFDDDEARSMAVMKDALTHFLRLRLTPGHGDVFTVRAIEFKRWRYSHPLSKAHFEWYALGGGLFLSGDAFGGPSLTGARKSALALAHHLIEESRRR